MQLVQLCQRRVRSFVNADVEVPERDSCAAQQLLQLLLQFVGVPRVLLLLRRLLLPCRLLQLLLRMLVLHVALNLRLQLLVQSSVAGARRCLRCRSSFAAACTCAGPLLLLILLRLVFMVKVLVKGHLVPMLLADQQVQHMHAVDTARCPLLLPAANGPESE
jgi:hypothetical protein